jgi:hypothetical protein
MDTSDFDAEVRAALELLGASASDEAFDGEMDPEGLCVALSALDEGSVLVRVSPALADDRDDHGPLPLEPRWLLLSAGTRAVKLAPLRRPSGATSGDDGDGVEEGSVAQVEVEREATRCCDAPSCTVDKARSRVWLVLDGGARWLLATRLDDASGVLPRLARRLAERLDVEVVGVEGEGTEAPEASAEGGEGPASTSATRRRGGARVPLSAAQLARFGLRMESDLYVARDYASIGPRAGASRQLVSAILLAMPAAALWVVAVRAALADGAIAFIAGMAVLAALLSIAAYGFYGVSRFSARYVARSAPLFWTGHDRFVVAPWVGRDGEVCTRPEGRLGAAIPFKEWTGVAVADRGDVHAVEIDSLHGVMEVLTTPDPAVAEAWAAIIEARIRAASHATKPAARAAAA